MKSNCVRIRREVQKSAERFAAGKTVSEPENRNRIPYALKCSTVLSIALLAIALVVGVFEFASRRPPEKVARITYENVVLGSRLADAEGRLHEEGWTNNQTWRDVSVHVLESQGETSLRNGFLCEYRINRYVLFLYYNPFDNEIIGKELIRLDLSWRKILMRKRNEIP
jgi:hypothetical protein